jgi:hypothetical protein
MVGIKHPGSAAMIASTVYAKLDPDPGFEKNNDPDRNSNPGLKLAAFSHCTVTGFCTA